MTRRILSLLAGVLLLAAIVVVNRLSPSADRQYEPIASTGGIREEIDTVDFQIRVDRVGLAKSIKIKDSFGAEGRPRSTAGTWVVVWATASATRKEVSLRGSEIATADGDVYAATPVLGALDTAALQPGIPAYGAMLFEVPAAKLPGAVLKVHTQLQEGLRLLGAAAEVPLNLPGTEPEASVVLGAVREV
ncbi:hypothetical protein ACQPYK_00805 [Streptosporangium sp. CA-135522]|uniref:hypothetical protein n=1 Tax=Streptosporangium sp. CA-135522 TaxID=3240072 RepID=UPI003D8CD515